MGVRGSTSNTEKGIQEQYTALSNQVTFFAILWLVNIGHNCKVVGIVCLIKDVLVPQNRMIVEDTGPAGRKLDTGRFQGRVHVQESGRRTREEKSDCAWCGTVCVSTASNGLFLFCGDFGGESRGSRGR